MNFLLIHKHLFDHASSGELGQSVRVEPSSDVGEEAGEEGTDGWGQPHDVFDRFAVLLVQPQVLYSHTSLPYSDEEQQHSVGHLVRETVRSVHEGTRLLAVPDHIRLHGVKQTKLTMREVAVFNMMAKPTPWTQEAT